MNQSRHHSLSRRGFCFCCVAATAAGLSGGWLTPREAYAQSRNIVDLIREHAATDPIEVTRLRRDVSVFQGSGGNVAVLTGPDGKVLVDAGITASKPRILQALSTLGREPIARLINTHWHFDHADGNEWLHGEGAAILAHENTRKHLQSAQRVDDWDFNFPASPSGAIPQEVISADRSLRVNGSTLELTCYAPAHTDGDIAVLFAEADVLHTGDTFWNGIYPFIDYSTGGSIRGMIAAAEANVRKARDTTIVIPGHGPVGNRAGLVAFRDMLVAIHANVAALKARGMSVEQAIAAHPTAAFDEVWGKFVVGPDFFTRLVYEGA
ncbi:MAG TPA: MBL fold metallo-hydrolase [Roseomonas sp.]